MPNKELHLLSTVKERMVLESGMKWTVLTIIFKTEEKALNLRDREEVTFYRRSILKGVLAAF